jgi:glutamine amidotransferase
MNKICILDYGMGNITSLNNAINKIGHKTIFFSESSEICSNFLIIPGVGAFNSAIEIFKKKFIDIKIKKFLEKEGNFLLGICLGKQLLYSASKENGLNTGLDLIKGEVELLSTNDENKLPHVVLGADEGRGRREGRTKLLFRSEFALEPCWGVLFGCL